MQVDEMLITKLELQEQILTSMTPDDSCRVVVTDSRITK